MLAVEPPADLLTRAREGESEAFAALVHRHQRMVFSLSWHFFHDPALAEDLAQEVFVQLFQHLPEIDTEAHLVFWLRQVAIRKCIDHARWWRRHATVAVEVALPLSAEAADTDPLELEQLRRLVAALPAKLRAVVTLRYQEDMQPGEIARLLGCPLNSVKSRLQRALALLRKRMKT